MVKLKVSLDNESDEFLIHKSFICFYSPYFAAAFNGPFKEGESQTSELEDVCPIAFGLFVSWLYSQRVEYINGNILMREEPLELLLLAERLLIPRLQNETITLLAKDAFPKSPISKKFGRLYENTVEGSPLRRFFIARQTGPWYATDGLVDSDDYPRQMLLDMFILASTGYKHKRITEEIKKTYHVGEKDVRFALV